MTINKKIFAAIAAIGLVACLTGRANAHSLGSAADGQRAEAIASPAAFDSSGCVAKTADCCPKPCIRYCQKRPCRKACCDCAAPRKLTLCVQDPCCCKCKLDIPVCVPACCQGEPCVDSRCALFGRGIVTYRWCCGYKLTVTFKPCGDVLVSYFGA